jgi:hypothetical protein
MLPGDAADSGRNRHRTGRPGLDRLGNLAGFVSWEQGLFPGKTQVPPTWSSCLSVLADDGGGPQSASHTGLGIGGRLQVGDELDWLAGN